jgi:hypothetical protein
MKHKFKLNLSINEKERLRLNKVKIADIPNYNLDELVQLMDIEMQRAKEILALIEFQKIPSIGIKFAEDLVFLGYYSINEIIGKSGAVLLDQYELKKGFWIDPCLEDQFRLLVYVAETNDLSKKWWDFTMDRKKYRLENSYPTNRPKLAWYESNDFINKQNS